MNVTFENYDPKRHDKHEVLKLMYNADIEMNSLFFGDEKNCNKINEELMNLEKKYLDLEDIKLAITDGQIVGLVLGYDVNKKKKFDVDMGRALGRVMGHWWLLKRTFLFIKARNMGKGRMDKDGYYIFILSVNSEYRGFGIGARIIEMMAKKHNKLYLHVNSKNIRGQKFYKKMGFEEKEGESISHNGKQVGAFLMKKQKN